MPRHDHSEGLQHQQVHQIRGVYSQGRRFSRREEDGDLQRDSTANERAAHESGRQRYHDSEDLFKVRLDSI